MKKTLLSLCLALLATAAFAIPAKKGVTKTIRLADGTELRAELQGDELMHYYLAEDGKCYVENTDGNFVPYDMEKGKVAAAERRAEMRKASKMMKAKPLRLNSGTFKDGNGYYGKKKGLIILVQFPDLMFKNGHDNDFYQKLANQENYNEGNFRGSVRDYYYAQSNGQFELTFDVMGPYTAPESYAYYGKNSASYNGSDAHVGTLVSWACKQVDDQVDFKDYDWDGDGYVDQVFVLFAGVGENYGASSDHIWPHMFYLSSSDIKQPIALDGVFVNTYACSCELNSYGTVDGMGTICHEFSHCMGFADLYDTTYSGGYGMSDWDLLHSGCYNGNSFCPANFTGFERWVAGWTTPIELKSDTIVSEMKSLSDNGDTYVIYNEANRDEFYLIDNRQRTGWDSSLPGSGLLITHVDYNKKVWDSNSVNDDPTHQRMTPFHADNLKGGTASYRSAGYDAYPFQSNDSLTNTSAPNASLFNTNVDGTALMNKAVLDIKRNDDGTMAFRFRGMKGANDNKPGAVLFEETFDKCSSTGGNDGIWNKGANGAFKSDNSGWTYSKSYGANKCARFGTTSVPAKATTPIFSVSGKAHLTFKAAPWDNDDNVLDVYWGNKMLERFFMENGQWNELSLDFEADAYSNLSFETNGRLFLDDVKVIVPEETGITFVNSDKTTSVRKGIYTIDGRYLGTNEKALGKGLYIINGKKMVK